MGKGKPPVVSLKELYPDLFCDGADKGHIIILFINLQPRFPNFQDDSALSRGNINGKFYDLLLFPLRYSIRVLDIERVPGEI